MKEELELQKAEAGQEEGQAETFREESSARTTIDSTAKGKSPKSPKYANDCKCSIISLYNTIISQLAASQVGRGRIITLVTNVTTTLAIKF